MWAAIGTTILVFSAGTCLCAILDWILLAKQKSWIKDKSASLWIWLSYQKSMPYVSRLTDYRVLGGIMMVEAAIVLLANMPSSAQFGAYGATVVSLADVAIIAVAVLCSLPLLRQLWGFLTNPPLLRWLVPKCVVVLIVAFYGVKYLGGVMDADFQSLAMPTYGSFGRVSNYTSLVFSTIAYLFWTFVYTMTLIALVYGLVIGIMIAGFKSLQFLVLRIAEHEKGPVVAISALLTAVVAALKLIIGD